MRWGQRSGMRSTSIPIIQSLSSQGLTRWCKRGKRASYALDHAVYSAWTDTQDTRLYMLRARFPRVVEVTDFVFLRHRPCRDGASSCAGGMPGGSVVLYVCWFIDVGRLHMGRRRWHFSKAQVLQLMVRDLWWMASCCAGTLRALSVILFTWPFRTSKAIL